MTLRGIPAPKLIQADKQEYMRYLFDRAINSGARLRSVVDTTPAWKNLLARYNTPITLYTPDGDVVAHSIERKYHNFSHVEEGVMALAEIEPDCECASLNSVLLAWFYHDAFYDITSGPSKIINNEQASAELAMQDLINMGWPAEYAGRVYDLVMHTKHNENPPETDYEANLIVDIDLLPVSIRPIEAFFASTRKVRQEYSVFSDEVWGDNRIKFWKGFLDRKKDRIFRTRHFEHLNSVTSDNIQKEMFSLAREKVV